MTRPAGSWGSPRVIGGQNHYPDPSGREKTRTRVRVRTPRVRVIDVVPVDWGYPWAPLFIITTSSIQTPVFSPITPQQTENPGFLLRFRITASTNQPNPRFLANSAETARKPRVPPTFQDHGVNQPAKPRVSRQYAATVRKHRVLASGDVVVSGSDCVLSKNL